MHRSQLCTMYMWHWPPKTSAFSVLNYDLLIFFFVGHRWHDRTHDITAVAWKKKYGRTWEWKKFVYASEAESNCAIERNERRNRAHTEHSPGQLDRSARVFAWKRALPERFHANTLHGWSNDNNKIIKYPTKIRSRIFFYYYYLFISYGPHWAWVCQCVCVCVWVDCRWQ